MIDNIPRIFSTQPPHQNCSRYYVYENGLIRVKLATARIIVQPGKNICFVKDWGEKGHEIRWRTKYVKVLGERLYYTEIMKPLSGHQSAAEGARPLDFYLDSSSDLIAHKDHHRGHKITAGLNATIVGLGPIKADKLDAYLEGIFGEISKDLSAEKMTYTMSLKTARAIT